MKFTTKKTRAEVVEAFGSDWHKIVKVDGGYMLFEAHGEYETWRRQK